MTVDVAEQLASGRPSVNNTQTYVSACHAVGYQHPDLTAHGAQIVEWYSGEEGVNLSALEADCAALRAAATAADEALRVTRDGQAAVSAAWEGQSGSIASDFLDRHYAAGVGVARSLHAAAVACEALRDALGRAVEKKLSAAISIDDRRAGERPAWLAAAAIVTSGAAAREEAADMVTRQITPYVDTDIRTEWVGAMRSSTASAAAAYEDALRQLNGLPTADFEVPGQFGAPTVRPHVIPAAAQTVPAAALSAPPTLSSSAPMSEPAAQAELPPSLPDSAANQPVPSAPPPEPAAGLGAAAPTAMPAMPDMGNGFSGLVGQIADALGGLFDDMPDSRVDDVPEPEPIEPDEDDDEPGNEVLDDDDEAADPEVKESEPEDVPIADGAIVADPPPVAEPVVEAASPPSPPSPPEPQPEQLMAEQPDVQTPCEIAADELAQVGQ